MLERLLRDQEGLTTIEYSLLLVLVAVSALVAWTTLASRTSAMVAHASDRMQ